MNENENLFDFLTNNVGKSNQELAEQIAKRKGLKNSALNVVLFQEKKSLCATAEKLKELIKGLNPDAELIIKNKKNTFKP